MKIELTQDEAILIHALRTTPPYATLTIEKRPLKEKPEGYITRVTIQESYLTKDVIIPREQLEPAEPK